MWESEYLKIKNLGALKYSKLISILLLVFVRTPNKSHTTRINSSTRISDFQAPVPNGPTSHLFSLDLLESLTRLLQWKLSRFKTFPSAAATETNVGRVIKVNIRLRISRIINRNFQRFVLVYWAILCYSSIFCKNTCMGCKLWPLTSNFGANTLNTLHFQ